MWQRTIVFIVGRVYNQKQNRQLLQFLGYVIVEVSVPYCWWRHLAMFIITTESPIYYGQVVSLVLLVITVTGSSFDLFQRGIFLCVFLLPCHSLCW